MNGKLLLSYKTIPTIQRESRLRAWVFLSVSLDTPCRNIHRLNIAKRGGSLLYTGSIEYQELPRYLITFSIPTTHTGGTFYTTVYYKISYY
jgi:hypothetical protein